MMRKPFSTLGIVTVCLLCFSCTERRTASEPVADGDTIEVIMPEGKVHQEVPADVIDLTPDTLFQADTVL